MLQRKREAEAKLQYANKPDKLQQAKDEIQEVKHEHYWHFLNRLTFYITCSCTVFHFEIHYNFFTFIANMARSASKL